MKFLCLGNFTERFKYSSSKDFEFGKVFLSLNPLGNPILLLCSCESFDEYDVCFEVRFDLGILYS